MRFPGSITAAMAVCAAYAASPAAAQTQTPPPNPSSATGAATPAGSTQAPALPYFLGSPLIPGWSFDLTTYGWLSSVRTRINTPTLGGGVATTDVFVPFGDILSDLRFGVVVAGEARYDRFSVLTDFIYLNLGMNLSRARVGSINPGSGRIDIPTQQEVSAGTGLGTTVWTLAGGYTLAAGPWGHIDAIAGTRLLAVDVITNYNLSADILLPNRTIGLARSGTLSTDVSYWDAIGGVTGRFEIPNSSFFVPYYFDVGTGDLPFTWEGFTGIGYHASWADLSLGYRYLDFQNHEGARVQNLAMGGVIFAASFHF
jgi:hypothetical protein